MPYGFIGKACSKYLSNVSVALSAAHSVHSKNPHSGSSGGGDAPPALPNRNNHNLQHSPDSASSGGYATKVGNQTNVVVEQGEYVETLNRIMSTDTKMAEAIHSVLVQIEEMCSTIYIVPDTLPKYLALVEKMKSSLGDFQTVTDEVRVQAHSFVDEIVGIDGR